MQLYLYIKIKKVKVGNGIIFNLYFKFIKIILLALLVAQIGPK